MVKVKVKKKIFVLHNTPEQKRGIDRWNKPVTVQHALEDEVMIIIRC
jgi:hypothetical protein